MSEKCQNTVPRGHVCPICGNEHDQMKPKIGAGIAVFAVILVIAGFGFYAWTHRDYGYGY